MQNRAFISYCSKDKPVADAVCHRLEENGIPCWIAPRDVTSIDWAGSIMRGLHNCNIFVVVISANSIVSPEVLKEVTEATRCCEYILPFKVDREEMSEKLRYHLAPCHWVEAMTPPLEAHIQELIHRINHLSEQDSVYLNHGRLKLKERILLPRNTFLGRDNEIAEIAACLNGCHVLFLHGMGGIGKSEICKEYARRYRGQYDTIVFTGFVSSLSDLIRGEEIGISNMVRIEGENDEAWLQRKMEALRSAVNERTLLVIDNFDTEDDTILEEVLQLPCHILLTSRFEHPDYPGMAVRQISDPEQVRKLFFTHFGRKVSDPDLVIVDEILKLIQYHTITVELIARQMKASFFKPAQMLERLRNTGLNLQLKEKVRLEGSNEKLSAFDYIRGLFRLSGLSETERHLLCCMSMVPFSGIDIHLLGEILDIDSFDDVNGLLMKSWLNYSEDDDLLSLHPVICDVVREELHPTVLECRDYIHGLYTKLTNCWFFRLEEKNKRYPLLRFFLRQHPDPVAELWNEYLEFINISWICGDYGTAIETGRRAVGFALEHFGGETQEAGLAAYYLGTAFHNSGDEAQAEEWYKEALKHWQASLPADDSNLAVVTMKIARSARLRGDLREADELYRASGKIYGQLLTRPETWPEGDDSPPYYRDYLVELERQAIAEQRYEDALILCRRNHELIQKAHGEENAALIYTYTDLGICCSMLGQYGQADEYLQQALRISRNIIGENSIQTFRVRESIADNCLRRGNREQARKLYIQLELDAEKALGEHAPVTERIRGKREKLDSCGV